MANIQADIAWDFFNDKGMPNLHAGQDVTAAFEGEIGNPVKAVVLVPVGPGGGNPVIGFTFMDEDHAWEWFSNSYMPDDPCVVEEFEHYIGK